MSSESKVIGKLERGTVEVFYNSSRKRQKYGFIKVKESGERIWFHLGDHRFLESTGERKCRFYRNGSSLKEVREGSVAYFVRETDDKNRVKALYWCLEGDVRRRPKDASHQRRNHPSANYWEITKQHTLIPTIYSTGKGYVVTQTSSA